MSECPGSPASFGQEYVSFALRQHLAAAHHLPAGYSYLVPREDLAGFHDRAHAERGRLAGWLRLRRLRKARQVSRA